MKIGTKIKHGRCYTTDLQGIIDDSFYYDGLRHGPSLFVDSDGSYEISMMENGTEKSYKAYKARPSY